METGLAHLHNLLRWAVLLLLIFSLINSFGGWSGKKKFTTGNRKVLLYTLISVHVQLLLGFVLYFLNGWHNIWGMSGFMKDSTLRFWAMEHPLTMILGITAITIGYSKAKKRGDSFTAHRVAALLFTLGLILILAGIPWPFRGEGIERALFPGM